MTNIQNIGFFDFETIKNDLWFCDIFTGNIVNLNLNNSNFSIVYNFEQDKSVGISNKMQYGLVKKIKEKLLFIPRNAHTVFLYDIEKAKASKIEVQNDGFMYKPLFIDVVEVENSLFLIPGRYSYIVEIDTCLLNIKYYSIEKAKNELFTNCNIIQNNNEIIIFEENGKGLLCFNVISKKIKSISLKLNTFKALSAVDTEQIIFYAGFGKRILMVEKQSYSINWIDKYDDCEEPVEGISNLLKYNEDIFMIAINQPIIYKISLEIKKVEVFVKFDWGKGEKDVWSLFTKCDVLCAKIFQNTLIIYSTVRKAIIGIELDTKKITYYDTFIWENENKKIYIENQVKIGNILKEGIISIEDFLHYNIVH